MKNHARFATVALTACSLFAIGGCASATPSPSNTSASSPMSSPASPAQSGGDFEVLLPPNSTGSAVVFRSEGSLNPGEPIEALAPDNAEGGWVAQFACDSDGKVTAEVVIEGVTTIEPTTLTCGVGSAETFRFSGSGTIALRITGASDGIYVIQLSKDPSV